MNSTDNYLNTNQFVISMKKIKKLAGIIILIIFMISCVSLKQVNDFSTSSLEGIKKYESISLDFKKACNEHCLIDNLKNLNMDISTCDCSLSQTADSVTLIIFNGLKNYFDGLAKLSNNELTTYKLDDLSKALSKNDFGDIEIAKEEVEAYSKISKILLKAFTDGYRKRKLSIYVKEASESVDVLLNHLNNNLSIKLCGKLNSLKGKIRSYYFDIKEDATISDFNKRNSLESYSKRIEMIKGWENEIECYSKIILKIKMGHIELGENIDRINVDEIKNMLAQYASDIEGLKSEINKLRNK